MSGRTLNPITIALDAMASETSFSVMPPAALRTMFTRTSSCGSFRNASVSAPSEPCTSAFTTRFSSGISARSAWRIRSDSVGGRLTTSSAARAFASRSVGDVTRLALVVDLAEVVARGGHGLPAEQLHGLGRAGDLERVAVLVLHRPDLAVRGARHERVADVERALLHEHGRDRPAALVEVRLDHGAPRTGPSARP